MTSCPRTTVAAAALDRHGAAPADVVLPAWPVLTMLWGFPITWLLGATVPLAIGLAVVMTAFLVRHRAAVVVPGVAPFAAFVAWTLPTGLMLDSGPRLLGFGFRTAVLVVALVTLVYAVSARQTLTRARVVAGLTAVWVFTIVGGLLGMAFPDTRLSTPVGRLLPGSVAGNSYVRDLFFPPFAEVQHPWGSPTMFVRPSAPFPYANSWGVAVLLLTPVALAGLWLVRSHLARVALLVAAALMLVPAAATSNRGMFVALALAAGYVLVRLAARDRAVPVLSIGAVGLLAGVALWAGGLFERIGQRQEYGQSAQARLMLYHETVTRALDSPLLGFGAPRPSAGQELSVGTQGYVWMLLFSHGIVGLVLFLAFLWGATVRTWRGGDDVDVVLHAVLVVASAAVVVYGLDLMQLLAIVLVTAVLLRRDVGSGSPGEG